MKLIRICTLILAAAMLLSGCDRIRSMMGKPTSRDLERLKVEAEAQRKAERDSLARVEEAAADTAAVAAPQAAAPEKPAPKPAQSSSFAPATGLLRYSVMVGSYVKDYNVRAMKRRMEKRGEAVLIIPFKSGFTGVAVLTTDNYADARTKLREMIASGSVPSDSWIYDTAWARHK